MKRYVMAIIMIFCIFVSGSVFPKKLSLVMDARTHVSLRAATLAVKYMSGKYSWEEFRTCSSFVSGYLRQLSFPVDGLQGQYDSHPDPFPWSGVIYQTDWVKKYYPDYIQNATLDDFLNQKLWGRIKPGSVIYLQTAEGHNGYNAYYHTAVLVGYLTDGSPQFAEIAAGMNNASYTRSFKELTKNYKKRADGTWDTTPYATNPNIPPGPLLVTWFDPLAILHQGKLWQQPGKVIPNADYLEKYDYVLSVNLFNGTTTIFEKIYNKKNELVWEVKTTGGRDEFYAVTGRYLPANKKITAAFANARSMEIYDGDFGVYVSEKGIYQHTWTPQMMSDLEYFQYSNGFGGLNGGTDIAVLRPQVFGLFNSLDDYHDWSPFTIHKIPDVNSQDILLREDLLIEANQVNHSPIEVPYGYKSSGCVNYEKESWSLIKNYLSSKMKDGKRIAVVFSYPNFDQNLLPTIDLFKAPFTGSQFSKWCNIEDEKCDTFDRRDYRKTYLEN